MKIDYYVLNKKESLKAIEILQQKQADLHAPERVFVIEDQIVPANSPEISQEQRKMADFALEKGTEYFYGEAMAAHCLIEKGLHEGAIVVGADEDLLMVGAVGSLGFALKAEALAEGLQTGELELEPTNIFRIELKGSLAASIDAGCAARALVQKLKKVAPNTIIEFSCFEGNLSLTDKMSFCGYCHKLGALSARFTNPSGKADFEMDLSEVKEPLPIGEAVNTVYLGGAYGGSLAAIKQAAEILKGKTIADKVRLNVAPASAAIYVEAANAGYLTTIMDAGGLVLNQCALPPVQARIGAGEVMLSNDIHQEQDYAGEGGIIYLCSTYAAVQAALTGRIGGEI